MPRFSRGAAFAAVLTIAAPVWAQSPVTAEDLNRQELNRLAYAQQPGRIVPPDVFIADAVGVNTAALAAGRTFSAPRFPGLLTLLGLGVAAGLTVVDAVVAGDPNRY